MPSYASYDTFWYRNTFIFLSSCRTLQLYEPFQMILFNMSSLRIVRINKNIIMVWNYKNQCERAVRFEKVPRCIFNWTQIPSPSFMQYTQKTHLQGVKKLIYGQQKYMCNTNIISNAKTNLVCFRNVGIAKLFYTNTCLLHLIS